MKSFTTKWRLQGLSTEEIAGRFEEVVLSLTKSQTFNGRKLKAGPLLNALALWFLELPEPERRVFAAQQIARLETFLADDEEEVVASQPPLQVSVPVDANPKPSRKPKKRGTT